MDSLVNEFAQAYQSGDAIRRNEEQKRLADDMKNTFSEVMQKKDVYGGEEGALKEAARRFGETGNINGFNLATQQAATYKVEREAKLKAATEKLGSAAIWLYGEKDQAKKQSKYELVKSQYEAAGGDVRQWPKEYSDEVGLSMLGQQEGIKFWDDVNYKLVESKRKAAGTGGRGTGSSTSIVQVADRLVKTGARNPDTGKPYTAAESTAAAAKMVKGSKGLSKQEWLQKNIPLMGRKAATAAADTMEWTEEEVSAPAKKSTEKEDWRTFAK